MTAASGVSMVKRVLVEVIADTRSRLRKADVDGAERDARLIVEHFTGTNRLDGLVTPERPVGKSVLERIDDAILRRIAGEPVHRIIGEREFYGLILGLNAATLEPRPDSETLVDLVLPFARECAEYENECRILDLGAGSGAIGLALLSQLQTASVVASEISGEARTMAVRNGERHGFSGRYQVIESDWFSAIRGSFHLIVSNPPYIRSDELDTLSREVRDYDPVLALDGGYDGLAAYRKIASVAGSYLYNGGRIGVEIGYDQASPVCRIFKALGFSKVVCKRDIAGHQRALLFAR